MPLKTILLSVLITSSAGMLAQYDKCLYHSMWPLLKVKATSNADYRISFTCGQDSVYGISIASLKPEVKTDAQAVNALRAGLEQVAPEDIAYCLPENVVEQKIVLLLSTRTHIPRYGERNIPQQTEESERESALASGARFLNLGSIFFHRSQGGNGSGWR